MYKALKTFTCKDFAMYKGQEKEIEDINIINDLLNVGYIEEIVEEPTEEIVETDEVVEEPTEEIVETEEVETEIKEEVEKPKKTTSKNKK